MTEAYLYKQQSVWHQGKNKWLNIVSSEIQHLLIVHSYGRKQGLESFNQSSNLDKSHYRKSQFIHSISFSHLLRHIEINWDIIIDIFPTDSILLFFFQMLNEMPLPVNVCFKKSIVEMLGHSLGELNSRVVSPVNPFDAHVPMVTLQPDQVFTIPLAVAYHSSLHIQPAAAEYVDICFLVLN